MSIICFEGSENPNGIIGLVEALAQADSQANRIVIQFPNAYLYGTIYPIIASWRKGLPDGTEVELDLSACQEAARRLVRNVGLLDVVQDNRESPSSYHKIRGNIPLQPIVPGHATEQVLDRVYGMVDEWAGEYRDISAFRVILSELAENILVHSNADAPGYVYAKLHISANNDRCEITFADTGIGILHSYLEGTNEDAKKRIHAGASALEIALDGLVSSKPQSVGLGGRSHFGYGLYTVKRLIEMNRGRMTLISGNEYVTMDRYRSEHHRLDGEWNGTIVSLLIDLGNPLPLEDVYDEEVGRIVPDTGPAHSSRHDQDAKDDGPVVSDVPRRRIVLSETSSRLLSREAGLAARAEVATALATPGIVEIDLDGVDDITPSVADECFGKLAQQLGESRFRQRVIFVGGSPILHRLIEFVIANRLR